MAMFKAINQKGLKWVNFNYSVELNTGGSSFSTQYIIKYTNNSGVSTSTTITLSQAQGGLVIPNSNIYSYGDSSSIKFGYYINNPNDNRNLTVITNSYPFNISRQTVSLTGYKLN